MSVRVISDVFKFSQAKGAARLVLIALADVANDEGEVSAYARSEKILGQKANCDRRSVQRGLHALVELGEVEVTKAGGGWKSASYQIHLSEEGRQDVAPEAAGQHPWGDNTTPLRRQDVAPFSPSSSVNVHPSPSRESESAFDLFWAFYPRRLGKGAALRAWEKARTRKDEALIVKAAGVFAKHVQASGADMKFVPHPATWLNRDGWEDDLVAENQPRMPRGADATARTLEWMRNGRGA